MQLLNCVGNLKGHYSNKENRAQKLIAQWGELSDKFEAMVERGSVVTETSRLAYAVLVMMDTGIRIGNEDSSEGWICENQILAKKDGVKSDGTPYKVGDVIYRHPSFGQHVSTYGITTLLNQHVSRDDNAIWLSFTGKKLVDQNLKLTRDMLLRHFRKGDDNERWLGVDYDTLKSFVKRYVGRQFKPKDIRTATVNIKFIELFNNYIPSYAVAEKKSERKALLKEAIAQTAQRIGHTAGVCRSAYLSKTLLQTIADI